MLHGEQVTGVFGNEAYSDADELITYAAGDSLKFNNRIIVRINPANATLAKEDIHLINSKGESLDDLIEVTDVKDFTGLITRGDYATGLKQITFVRKAGEATTDAAFGEATSGVKTVATGKTATGQALFAVSVNNTKSDAADRFVSTTFDVTISYGWFVPATEFAFTVKGDGEEAEATPIAQLRNRWSAAEKKTIGEDQTKELPSDKWPAELVWQNITGQTAPKAPAAEYTLPAWDKLGDKTANVNSGDARYGIDFKYIEIEKGGHFTVSGLNTNKIDYYYVALDKDHAVESAPSEWESWNSYSYEGLLEMTPSTEEKVITVKSDAAEGDIIGFRVYAVNYDGTLADPDGMAFYVKVGEPKAPLSTSVNVNFTAVNANATITTANITANVENEIVKGNLTGAWNLGIASFDPKAAGLKMDADMAYDGTYQFVAAAADKTIDDYSVDTDISNTGAYKVVNVRWALLTNKYAKATKLSEVTQIGIAVDHPGAFYDAGTLSFTINGTDPDHHDAKINYITVNVSKVFPTQPVGFKWRSTFEPVAANKYVFYPRQSEWALSSGAWTTGFANDLSATPYLTTTMDKYATGTSSDYEWEFFKIKKGAKDGDALANNVGLSGVAYDNATEKVFVTPDHVGSDTKSFWGEYGIKYAKISCTLPTGTTTLVPDKDKRVNAFAGEVVFESLPLMFTYELMPYTYATVSKPATGTQATATSTQYAIAAGTTTTVINVLNLGWGSDDSNKLVPWKPAAKFDGKSTGGSAVTVTSTPFKDILKGTNSVLNTMSGVYDPANYVSVNLAANKSFVHNSAGEADYFDLTGTTEAQPKFTTIAGAGDPLGATEETVQVTLIDCFGNEFPLTFNIWITPAAGVPDGFINN